MDIRSTLAPQSYSASRAAIAPGSEGGDGAFENLLSNFTDTLRQSEATAMSALSGGADPHALVQALAQTELAVETAVAVRDRVVQAYQEILRMPI